MKSGLEGRNNTSIADTDRVAGKVSMKSGLEGRNNPHRISRSGRGQRRLNEVRPRRLEQCNVPWDSEYNNVVSQ